MKTLIKYFKLGTMFITIILIISFISGLFNLIGINYNITIVVNIITMIMIFLIFGIIEGLNTFKKGFLAGFKIGIYFLVILFFSNFIFFQWSFGLSRLIYYIILLFSSIFGAMIGINRKKKQ